MVTAQQVREALNEVQDPELKRSLIELDMIRDIKVEGQKVYLTLKLTVLECPIKAQMTGEIREKLLALPEVKDVAIKLEAMNQQERDSVMQKAQESSGSMPNAAQFNQVDRIVAVMSGKGGVGKSLVTALLAISLAKRGSRVGILDADVTGPSIPKMFGLHSPAVYGPFGLLPALTPLGIEIMSMNLLLEREDDAVIWRGPMIGKAIKQFWEEVVWGRLDYLLVDLPPGTSDAPLTVMQSLPLSGAVIVTSPQDLASMIVRKAVRMAGAMHVPVLGIVENMSYFVCPDTGKHHEIFGPSRGEEMALASGAPLLAQLPLDPAIARLCDTGKLEEVGVETFTEIGGAFDIVCQRLPVGGAV